MNARTKQSHENGSDCKVEDWEEHRDEAKTAMTKINVMFDIVENILENTKHLQKLDAISTQLRIHNLMIGILSGAMALILVIRELKESDRDVSIGKSGIKIERRIND